MSPSTNNGHISKSSVNDLGAERRGKGGSYIIELTSSHNTVGAPNNKYWQGTGGQLKTCESTIKEDL